MNYGMHCDECNVILNNKTIIKIRILSGICYLQCKIVVH